MSRKRPVGLSPRCELCRLYQGCISPKMPVTGEGKLGVLILAEAPGKTEDERNVQLVGKSGQRLRSTLKELDIDLDEDCWKTNSIICRPPSNRTPTPKEMEYCRPHLVETIENLKPTTIITLGDVALKQLLDPYWDLDYGPLGRWVGYRIPLQPLNTWVCPTWHPSYLERESKNDYLAFWFKQHLKEAFELGDRPWKEVPNYKQMVEKVEGNASAIIEEMSGYDGMAAFDYETNCLKPEYQLATIVTASICWGRQHAQRCIAYPMTPENERATKRFLQSDIPKIGANNKFEIRWSMTKFGTPGRYWFWDTMQCSHVLDNRTGVTGNDFVAFTRLGLPPYSSHIKPLLKAGKGVTTNQILSEISMRQLLEYNGLDTISEYEIAVRQMRELGQKPPRKTR